MPDRLPDHNTICYKLTPALWDMWWSCSHVRNTKTLLRRGLTWATAIDPEARPLSLSETRRNHGPNAIKAGRSESAG